MQRDSAKFALVVLLLACTALRGQPRRARHIDDTIENVNLTDGMETIGGASVLDAANFLSDETRFPVALEMLEFERPKDFVTLDEALARLHSMQAEGPLAAGDKARLSSYEEFAKSHAGSEVVVARQKTFRLIRNRMSVREMLDEITRLDDEYEWKNYGTNTKPVIVIQPRVGSVLNWPIAPICKPRPVATEQVLAGCKAQQCSLFIQALSERNMSVIYISVDEPVVPGKPTADEQPPHGFVDLCSNGLTARDVLNRIAQSAHTSWTLGGIKGMRLVAFRGHY